LAEHLTIGSVRVVPPLVLAPMAGATSSPFRSICRELGAGLVCGEMVSANALVYASQKSYHRLLLEESERPVSMQIVAGSPESAATGVRAAAEAGADIVDLNLGCPVPKIKKIGAGAALLRDMGRAREVIEAAAEAAGDTPFTVKTRAGWAEGKLTFLEIGAIAAEAGCAAIALHARTAVQMYSGTANWKWIGQLVQECPLPVIGNGDVRSGADALRMFEETGCAGVMIGRHARVHPWVFAEARAVLGGEDAPPVPNYYDRMELTLRLCEGLCEHYGEHTGVLHARSALSAMSKGFRDAARFRERAHRLRSLEEIRTLFREYGKCE
jgi:tRNA-dihydrouridine synthase B